MIPASFDYIAAKSLDEAISLLAKHKDDAKILAGGHSLLPAMKLRLMQPKVLIDLGRIKDLSYIKEEGGQIRIGAMTTHFQVETSDLLRRACPLLPETASHLGDMQVRNKGTIGGSVAHSDPAADWPAAILALDAEIVAASAKGDRVIKASDFFVEMLTTALAARRSPARNPYPRRQRQSRTGLCQSPPSCFRICRGRRGGNFVRRWRQVPVGGNRDHRRFTQGVPRIES